MESPQKFRIALDAMGGDYSPGHEVEGAVQALRSHGSEIALTLVGDEKAIKAELAGLDAGEIPLEIVHASQVITMDDHPTAALKQKRNSSLSIGMRLQKEKKVDAFVSAGNTGAVFSAATLILGRIKGVSRPTIGAFIPSENGVCLLVDAGANIDCRARYLYEFGLMGSIYSKYIQKKENPRVGLLNIGEEKTKGNAVALEAYALLSSGSLNFIGNVEGGDILKSKADVVVCDGFVGNIVLKFGESVPGFMKKRLKGFSQKGIVEKISAGISIWPIKTSLRDLDPNESGGVPVLGVNGVAIIGHGSASPKGIKNMILCAAEVARLGVNHHIESALSNVHLTSPQS
jgi:glycerol-3-phosphate acyltransferase PlsX